jgi:putative ABC transport system permease protein
MKIRDTVRRAGRSLRQAKARTLLTSLAISVGAFTVTLALAAGAGGQSYADALIKNNGDASNLTVLPKIDDSQDDAPKEYGASSQSVKQGILTNLDVDKITTIDGIAAITPEYSISAAYMTRDAAAKKYETPLTIKADRTTIPLAAGALQDNQIPAGGVVVPEEYLGVLGFADAQAAIGQTLLVHIEQTSLVPGEAARESQDKVFTVVAVDKKSPTVLRYQTSLRISVEDGRSLYEYQTAGTAAGGEYYAVNVRVADGVEVKTVQAAIEAAGYSVFSLQDVQETLFQFINVIQWGAAGFGFLAILASVFGIINTQYISVLERTQQIGLMKALGARRKDVGRLFRYEAAWVGFLGGAIGTLLAVTTGLLNPWITKQLGLEVGTELLQFNPATGIVLIISLMLVAVCAGYFPARKASKLDPIEALRTE